jgi:hypothetical protein
MRYQLGALRAIAGLHATLAAGVTTVRDAAGADAGMRRALLGICPPGCLAALPLGRKLGRRHTGDGNGEALFMRDRLAMCRLSVADVPKPARDRDDRP